MLDETVGTILNSKAREICAVVPDATVYDALVLMAEKGIAAVVVMTDGILGGIVSAQDCGRVILQGKSPRDTRVREIAISIPITVAPSTTANDAMNIMTRQGIRYLPVVNEGKLCGLLTMADLVGAMVT